MRPCALHHAMLLLALSCPAFAQAEENREAMTASPRLDYQMDATRDEQVSYSGTGNRQPGRWVGTWYGADGSSYHGTYESGAPASAAAPVTPVPASGTAPDPAYVGSGKVVNGWYYPPPQTTTVVTEYKPVQKK